MYMHSYAITASTLHSVQFVYAITPSELYSVQMHKYSSHSVYAITPSKLYLCKCINTQVTASTQSHHPNYTCANA